jgi:hypothetical protein
MAYTNSDGLYLKYGTEKGVSTTAGEYRTVGALREVEFKLTLTSLTTTPAIVSDVTELPAGARIQEVEVITTTVATTGSSAALNVGTIQLNRTTTVDADGLVEALAVTALDAAGETTILRAPVSGTSVGDQIGTSLANTCFITASTSTGTFTAGAATVKVRYFIP